jgi:hypothetical protein
MDSTSLMMDRANLFGLAATLYPCFCSMCSVSKTRRSSNKERRLCLSSRRTLTSAYGPSSIRAGTTRPKAWDRSYRRVCTSLGYAILPFVVAPMLTSLQEDGDPSLKLWAQTLLVEDRADQGVSLQQWMGTLREKVCPSAQDVPLILSTWPD